MVVETLPSCVIQARPRAVASLDACVRECERACVRACVRVALYNASGCESVRVCGVALYNASVCLQLVYLLRTEPKDWAWLVLLSVAPTPSPLP
jgi:hypothetical protein